ncbi:MAG TPA: DUF5602 domain-containing protein [Stellaceae bacterium]|nr:DUF5602 domain-containing protein [Stellaceae bacterium]
MRNLMAAVALASVLAVPALAQSVQHAPPGGAYKKVSELVKLPDFLPGLGTLYVDPKTLPAGPFLAYDHKGNLVSTIYMIPLKDLNDQKTFGDLASPGGRVDHVSIYYNAGHPGVPDPHYHIVLWHVPKAKESLVAK